MAITFGILGFILLAVVVPIGGKLWFIPMAFGIFGFVSGIRYLSFQTGIKKLLKIVGMFLCACDTVTALMFYYF